MTKKYDLYIDEDDFLWIKMWFDGEDDPLFESVTDISKELSLPKYTVISSSSDNFMDYNTYKHKLRCIETGYIMTNSTIKGWLYLKEKEVVKRCLAANIKARTLKQIRAFYDKWKWLLKTSIGERKRHKNFKI